MSTETNAPRTTARFIAASTETPSATPRPPRPERVDLFGPIHKAIRFALADLLSRLGSASFAEEDGAPLLGELEALLAFCEKHARIEDTLMRPALGGRSTQVFDEGHARLDRLGAELRALAAALGAAPADRRELAGRTLYLHFGRYLAENLAHMAEEEQVLKPLLERLLGDAELLVLQGRITASLSDADKAESARWMLRAASRPERAELVQRFLASAPRPAVLAIVGALQPLLGDGDFRDLARRCDLVELAA